MRKRRKWKRGFCMTKLDISDRIWRNCHKDIYKKKGKERPTAIDDMMV